MINVLRTALTARWCPRVCLHSCQAQPLIKWIYPYVCGFQPRWSSSTGSELPQMWAKKSIHTFSLKLASGTHTYVTQGYLNVVVGWKYCQTNVTHASSGTVLRVCGFIPIREGSNLEEVVEKQADLIEYLKQHNTLLSKRLLNLTAQHWAGLFLPVQQPPRALPAQPLSAQRRWQSWGGKWAWFSWNTGLKSKK